jgi:hypothetical protein
MVAGSGALSKASEYGVAPLAIPVIVETLVAPELVLIVYRAPEPTPYNVAPSKAPAKTHRIDEPFVERTVEPVAEEPAVPINAVWPVVRLIR